MSITFIHQATPISACLSDWQIDLRGEFTVSAKIGIPREVAYRRDPKDTGIDTYTTTDWKPYTGTYTVELVTQFP